MNGRGVDEGLECSNLKEVWMLFEKGEVFGDVWVEEVEELWGFEAVGLILWNGGRLMWGCDGSSMVEGRCSLECRVFDDGFVGVVGAGSVVAKIVKCFLVVILCVQEVREERQQRK